VNFAGYVIHSAIHAARADVACVIHTHTRAGMAVASMKCGFLPMTQTAISCFPVAYHDYEGPAVDQAQVDAMPGGGVLGEMPLVVPEDIVARAVERRRVALAKRPTVELHWPAMLRLLDRRDPGWRD
jgi:hypothetical protein